VVSIHAAGMAGTVRRKNDLLTRGRANDTRILSTLLNHFQLLTCAIGCEFLTLPHKILN
jgi:hypothetical protein